MRLLFMMLADHAEVLNGKMYMMGAAWDQVNPQVLAGSHLAYLAIGLSVSALEAGDHKRKFAVILNGGGGLQAGEFVIGPSRQPLRKEITFLMALPVQLPLTQAGQNVIRLMIDGTQTGTVSYTVTPALPQPRPN